MRGCWIPLVVVAMAAGLFLTFSTPSVATAEEESNTDLLVVRTVPAVPGVRFALDGREFVSDATGVAWIMADREEDRSHQLEYLGSSDDPSVDLQATFARWCCFADDAAWNPIMPDLKLRPYREIQVGLNIQYPAELKFVDPAGSPVDTDRITSVTVRSSIGERFELEPGDLLSVLGNRVQMAAGVGLFAKDVTYSIDEVLVDGSNVVNRSQQQFTASEGREWRIQLLFYSARFSVKDALFRFPMGSAIQLEYPDGHTERFPLGSQGELVLNSLARGEYHVSIDGPGISFSRPVAISRNQDISLEFISYLDIAVVSFLAVAIILGLIFIGRPQLLSSLRSRLSLGWRIVIRKEHF